MEIRIPEIALVLMVGPSGSGKSTFARKWFKPTEIVSSDYCRALVSDDENDQSATSDAFDVLHYIVAKRLKRGLLTVVDATNVQAESRKSLIQLAKEYHVLPIAMVLNMSEKICQQRNALRSDRNFGRHVIANQITQLRKSGRRMKEEGFPMIFEWNTPEEVEQVTAIHRDPLYNNRKELKGPFDLIGDVHGCREELVELLQKLGYSISPRVTGLYGWEVVVPPGRTAVFVGDLVDRGPDTPGVLRLVMHMVQSGKALCVIGNHDFKLLRYLKGKQVQLTHGLAESVAQLSAEPPEFVEAVKAFLEGLISHYVLDGGRLVVAHAGLREEMHGRASGAVRSFCMYGETTGETDEFGLPVRYNWASEYKGKAMVVYGHTPVLEAEWLNHTIDIDTGCVFGGKLTGLRYPEKDLLSVPARQEYCVPKRPFLKEQPKLSLQQTHDDLLEVTAFMGKRIVETKYSHPITLREDQSVAALEVMSRFAVNPKWLIYLPPTMSPSETSVREAYLEHPYEAFEYYRKNGINQVVCEEKHMGSRAVIVVCKDEASALKAFGIEGEGIGTIYTRTGRPFFNDVEWQQTLLNRINKALETSGFYEKHQTSWVCLDVELMPWSAKAQALLQQQYASTGTAAREALLETIETLALAEKRLEEIGDLRQVHETQLKEVEAYIKAYQGYCWPVQSLDDYKIAPFHLLATEGKVHTGKDHVWHMESLNALSNADPLFVSTPYRLVHLDNEEEVSAAIDWWEKLTEAGGEGMVVKSIDFIPQGTKSGIQPAVKCRGREYLRIIYGPTYTEKQHLERLKSRSLNGKRSLALREFALSLEALDRFVAREPLQRIHECVFGILAMETEPVDPRL